MRIGQAIQICRLKRKVLQKDLAKQLKISPSLLSMIEKDQRDPGFVLTEEIAKKLEVPLPLILLLSCELDKHAKKFDKEINTISLATLNILSKL